MFDSIKTYAKKALTWMKKNWVIVLFILVSLGQYLSYSSKIDDAKSVMEAQRVAHSQQISAFEKSFREELTKREEISSRYEKIFDRMRDLLEADLEQIKQEQDKFRNELERDPRKIEEIFKKFGIEEYKGGSK